MKTPTGKLALAYRSLAVAEERAERFMAERDALQALLNERDAELDRHRETARQLDELVRDAFRKDPAMAARVCASLGVPVPPL